MCHVPIYPHSRKDHKALVVEPCPMVEASAPESPSASPSCQTHTRLEYQQRECVHRHKQPYRNIGQDAHVGLGGMGLHEVLYLHQRCLSKRSADIRTETDSTYYRS